MVIFSQEICRRWRFDIKGFSVFWLFFIFPLAIFAQEIPELQAQKPPKQDFFAAPFGEAVGYGYSGTAFGGGLIIGAGTGGALGLRILYVLDAENISFLEVNILARLYIFGKDAFSGPFAQLNVGPVIYADKNPNRSSYGNLSAGVTAGWRFLIGKNFFAEPSLRFGYPYLFGATVAVGFR